MFSEDYIVRLIRMATSVLARVLGLKQAGQYQEASALIDQMLEQLTGLKIGLIKNMDEQSFIALFGNHAYPETDRLWVVADLYKAQGELFEEQKEFDERNACYLRALVCYLEVVLQAGSERFAEPEPNIEALVSLLDGVEMPPETLYAIFNYYEQVGSFAKAEQTLTRLSSAPGFQEGFFIERDEFYSRLLNKTDQELAKGEVKRADLERKVRRK